MSNPITGKGVNTGGSVPPSSSSKSTPPPIQQVALKTLSTTPPAPKPMPPVKGSPQRDIFSPISQEEFINLFPSDIRGSEFLKTLIRLEWETEPGVFPPNKAGESKGIGHSYPVYPEIFAEILCSVRDRTDTEDPPIVIEIGAGFGRKSLLFSLANRNAKVFINDLPDANLETCEKFAKKMGARKENITIIPQDCLKFLQNLPADTQGRVDYIIATLVLHLLTDEERSCCLQSILHDLRPGGKVVLSVQTDNRLRASGIAFPQRDTPNQVKIAQLCTFEKDKTENWEKKVLYQEILPITESDAPTLTKELIRGKTRDLFRRDNNTPVYELEETESEFSTYFEKSRAKEKAREIIHRIRHNADVRNNTHSVFIEMNYITVFSPASLRGMLEEAGFTNITIYPIDEKGHTLPMEEIDTKKTFSLAAIAEKPQE